jgi:NAD(P)H-dependent FMN reductase
MSKLVRILGIAGSLRRESYNRATLREATRIGKNQSDKLGLFHSGSLPTAISSQSSSSSIA